MVFFLLYKEKIVLRCSMVKLRAKQCDAKALLICEGDDHFSVHENHLEHTCNSVPFKDVSKDILSEAIIERVRSLYKVGCRMPKSILTALRDDKNTGDLDYDSEPSIRQIKYQIAKIKKELYGDGELSMGGLKELLIKNSAVPDDLDQSFIVAFQVIVPKKLTLNISDEDASDEEEDTSDNPKFWFLMSTKRLLSNIANTRTICADETYKLLWMGFSGISIGTIDLSKAFHPLAFGFSSSEKTEDWAEIFEVSFFLSIF